MSHGKTKFIIFKVADNKKEIVLDHVSQEQDYEAFRTKLGEARDDKGNPTPRYAVYDVEYEIPGEGKRYVDCHSSRIFGWLAYLFTGARLSSSLGFLAKPLPSYVLSSCLLTPLLTSAVVYDLRQHSREPEERAQHPHLHPRR